MEESPWMDYGDTLEYKWYTKIIENVYYLELKVCKMSFDEGIYFNFLSEFYTLEEKRESGRILREEMNEMLEELDTLSEKGWFRYYEMFKIEEEKIPNRETLEALEELESGEDLESFNSVEELYDKLDEEEEEE